MDNDLVFAAMVYHNILNGAQINQENAVRASKGMTEKHVEMTKKMLFHKYALTKENPYLKNFVQERKAAKVPEDKYQLEVQNIIAAQQASLENMLDFFEYRGSNYDSWFKFYALNELLKYGYDYKNSKIIKRQPGMPLPFLKIDDAVLFDVYKNIVKTTNSYNVTDGQLKGLLNSEVFMHLYEYFLKKHEQERAQASVNQKIPDIVQEDNPSRKSG